MSEATTLSTLGEFLGIISRALVIDCRSSHFEFVSYVQDYHAFELGHICNNYYLVYLMCPKIGYTLYNGVFGCLNVHALTNMSRTTCDDLI